ncbi:MAG: methyltransferase domain-containing protein [Abditibacteriales bacterium]|nr:methyltransferase domain-containing protein [Abditibacteriales bacterium]
MNATSHTPEDTALRAEIKDLQQRLADVIAQNQRLQAELEAIRNSVGWRVLEKAYRLRRSRLINVITAPMLRLAKAYLRGDEKRVASQRTRESALRSPTASEASWEKLKASLHPVPCDLCGADQAAIVLSPSPPPHVVRCGMCGLIYFNPQPTPEALREFYSSESPEDYTPRLREWQGELSAQKAQKLTEELNFLEQWLRRDDARPHNANQRVRFLEVGCAFGHQLFCAQQKGWEVVGVELSAPAANWVRQELGLEVHNGTIESAARVLPPESFDIVLMSHVLEHVLHPTAVLQAAASLIKPGGVIAIYVPNGDSFPARHDFDHWEWTSFPEHLYYFSPSTLARLLTKCGFEVEQMWTCIGHSNSEQLYKLIQNCLSLRSLEEAAQVAETLGSLCLLSDLRVVARKLNRHDTKCAKSLSENSPLLIKEGLGEVNITPRTS